MEGKQYKKIIQAAVIVLAACIICNLIPGLGWNRYVTVKQAVTQDMPTEVEVMAQYGQISSLKIKADTSMASAETTMTIELYDDNDNMIFRNQIPLKELSVYEWQNIATDLYVTTGENYRLKLYTDQDSEILPQAYLYGIRCRYCVPFNTKDYLPYQVLVVFVALLMIMSTNRKHGKDGSFNMNPGNS